LVDIAIANGLRNSHEEKERRIATCQVGLILLGKSRLLLLGS